MSASIGSGGIHDYGGQPFEGLPPPPMEGHVLAPWEKQVDALVACLRGEGLLDLKGWPQHTVPKISCLQPRT